ncbi:MAG TPA: cyclic nucleotide-binding domain-containing protein [Acidimicrobiia bacterium]|jgi:CRP-like cAMP-binding protein
MTDLDHRVELLRKVWLFSNCTEDELARVAGLATTREVKKGEQLFAEGDPGEEFYVIVEGTADAIVDGDKLGDLDAGDFFGEMALIDGGERTATVVSTSPMSLLVLSRNDFNTMLSTAMPHVAPKLMQVMGQRIRELQKHAGGPLPW